MASYYNKEVPVCREVKSATEKEEAATYTLYEIEHIWSVLVTISASSAIALRKVQTSK